MIFLSIGLVISILAILFSLYTYFVHYKKIKEQTKLINDYQLQKIEIESIEEKKAKIRVSKDEIKTNILKFIELVKNQHIKAGFPESWHVNQ